MTVTKNSSAAKSGSAAEKRKSKAEKKKLTRLGKKLARVRIGPLQKTFTVHEDLICAKSPYFKNLLQKTRKELEDDCPVCYDDLSEDKRNITFCTKCGKNAHEACIVKWIDTEKKLGKCSICPMCRAAWSDSSELKTIKCKDLDTDSFPQYLNWIYQGDFDPQCQEDLEPNDNSYYHDLTSALILGEHTGDKMFQNEVIRRILSAAENATIIPSWHTIEMAHEKTEGACKVRRLLVDININYTNMEEMVNEVDDKNEYQVNFIKDVCKRYAELAKQGKKKEDVLDDYLEKSEDSTNHQD